MGNLRVILTNTPCPGPCNATHESISSRFSSFTLALQTSMEPYRRPPVPARPGRNILTSHDPHSPQNHGNPSYSPSLPQTRTTGKPTMKLNPQTPHACVASPFKTPQALLVHTSNPPNSLVRHSEDLSTLPRMAAAWLLLAYDSWPLLGESHRLPLPGNCAANSDISELIIPPRARLLIRFILSFNNWRCLLETLTS